VTLIGRDDEREAIDSLLKVVSEGRSGALVVRGEPGIGKTALLDYATEQADDFTVLTHQAIQSELEIPFGGLLDLLRPILRHRQSIPPPQASALGGALSLEVPMGIRGIDRFTIYAGTLSLIAAAAEERPLLAAVDDAQWLDAASAEALLFVARRLGSDGVAIVIATRSGNEIGLDLSSIPELSLSGLNWMDSRSLLHEQSSGMIGDRVAKQLHQATAGNPLALIECCSMLDARQLTGATPLHQPPPTGNRIGSIFARHLRGLREDVRAALLILSASDVTDTRVILEALEVAGISSSTLEVAEDRGIIQIDGARVDFHHPLLRSAVYHNARASQRRAAHAALAETRSGDRLVERKAWHLASAATFPDETVASLLEDVASETRRRGAHRSAAHAFAEAARLSPVESDRLRRSVEAAQDWLIHGDLNQAQVLIDAAMSASDDPLLRADIHRLRARVQILNGDVVEARQLLVDEARSLESVDPKRAAVLLMDATGPSFMRGEVDVALDLTTRALELAGRTGRDTELLACLWSGIALAAGGSSTMARAMLKRGESLLHRPESPSRLQLLYFSAAESHTWLEEYDEARRLLESGVQQIRRESGLGILPFALGTLSELNMRTGRWTQALADASEGLQLASDTGQFNEVGHNCAMLAQVEGGLGIDQACRGHVKQARQIAERVGANALCQYAAAALGLLEVSLGDYTAAISALEFMPDEIERSGLAQPGVVQWEPDLIESYVRTNRREDARSAATSFEFRARRTGHTWALAACARARGLLAPEDAFQHPFKEALELHDLTPTPFERARTQLCFGERLRRSGRRREARELLRRALDTFKQMGASPWVTRARAELRATGAPVPQYETPLLQELSAHELQVALTVSRGATNKETGAQLFLSPKTIEAHLGNIYRKLGVRSRTELAAFMARKGLMDPQSNRSALLDQR